MAIAQPVRAGARTRSAALLTSILLGAVSTAALLAAAPAAAQAPAPVQPAQQPAPLSPDEARQDPVTNTTGASEEASTQVNEVVVTAQRREERLQDVPIAITVVTPQLLESTNARNLTELQGAVPSVFFHGNSGGGRTYLTLRGATGLALNTGDEPVAIYMDEVYLGRGVVIGMADLLDVSGIEIVRGPQGTLQGRNATAGAVLLRTANPTRDFYARAYVSAAYPQEYRAQAVISGPVTDTIAIRAAVGYVDEEGWATNTFNGRHIGGGDSRQGRVVLSWRPDDRLDLRFTADYSRVHNEPAIFRNAATTFNTSTTGALVTTPTPQIPLPDAERRRIYEDNEIALNPGSFTTVVTGGGSARISYRTDFADLISVIGVRGTEVRALNDSDGLATTRQGFNEIVDNARQVSGEVRLQSNGDGPFSWIVGYYAYGENQSYDDNIYNLRFTVPTDTVTLYTGNIDTRSWAVFADGTYRFTDQLSLIGGVRYTQDDKRIDGFIRPTNFTTGVRTSTLYTGQVSYENTSYRVKLQYSPTEDVMLFIGYGTGFRAGGYNPFAVQPPYAPERIGSWEGGAKVDLFERRLSLSVTGYHNIYENLQLRAGVPTGGAIITNAGEAEINGVELEFTARPTDTFRISGNLAWTDAVFTSFRSARDIFDRPVDATGNRLPRTPEWQYFISAANDFPLGDGSMITAEANYRWRDEVVFFFTDQSLPTWRDGAGGELGARLSWRDPSQNWEVALFGTNLTNERLINTAAVTFSYPQVGLNKPRVFGVSLERRF